MTLITTLLAPDYGGQCKCFVWLLSLLMLTEKCGVNLRSINTNTDTGYDTDMDTWTPVKHTKFNPNTSIGVVSVSVSVSYPDTARDCGVRAS